jgi:hypothetical protein
MKDIDVTLSDAFRYFLNGGIFLVLLVIVFPELLKLDLLKSSEVSNRIDFFTVILVISLPFLIGSTLHVIHRMMIYSLLYRIISFFVNWFINPETPPSLEPGEPDMFLLIPWITITGPAFKYDYSRWYLENPIIRDNAVMEAESDNIPDYSTNLKLWASQTHFMYCIGMILVILLIAVKSHPEKQSMIPFFLEWWMISIVYIIAFLSHIRYMVFEYRLARLWKKIP